MGSGGERSEPTDQNAFIINNKKVSKNHAKKSKKMKSVKKSSKKFSKCKKLQKLPGLPVKGKSVPPSHIVWIYHRLTSTKSVLRQASTRLARAEILKSLVGVLEGRVKKRKLSAFEAEFKFEVVQSVGSLRSPPDPKNYAYCNNLQQKYSVFMAFFLIFKQKLILLLYD